MAFGDLRADLATEIEETGWTQRIETGIAVVDEQHREYFRLVNSYLETAARARSGSDVSAEVVERLNFLRRYAVEHFATEQKIMKESAYPGYRKHFEAHMYFLQRVGALNDRLRDEGHSDQLAREVHFQVLEWFIGHIQSADMKVVAFLAQDGQQAELPGVVPAPSPAPG